jgi:hypothetical protein
MLDLLVPCVGRDEDWRFWSGAAAYLFRLPYLASILLIGQDSVVRLSGCASGQWLPLAAEASGDPAVDHSFNKSRLLRAAVCHSEAPVLMFLDSDIRIAAGVVHHLYQQLHAAPAPRCAHLARVIESDPARRCALVEGCWPQTTICSGGRAEIRLLPWRSAGWRPGFGNLMLFRRHYIAVGLHDPAYVHYGWEDLDLLVRLQLAGVQVLAMGQACHQSHSDAMRSLGGFSREQAVAQMRAVFAAKFHALLQPS